MFLKCFPEENRRPSTWSWFLKFSLGTETLGNLTRLKRYRHISSSKEILLQFFPCSQIAKHFEFFTFSWRCSKSKYLAKYLGRHLLREASNHNTRVQILKFINITEDSARVPNYLQGAQLLPVVVRGKRYQRRATDVDLLQHRDQIVHGQEERVFALAKDGHSVPVEFADEGHPGRVLHGVG